MSLKTFYPPIDPSPGTRKTQDIALLETEFGDGYSQTLPKGLNHIRRKLSIRWDALTPDQAKAIVSFLEARQGYEAFYYTLPGETKPVQWTCKVWESGTDAGVHTVSAEFQQSFNLDG